MATSCPSSPSICSDCSGVDDRIQITLDAINWDALSSLGCRLLQVDSSHWGEHKAGGYNLVRFLHLHDSHGTILVARVPLRSEDDSVQQDSSISKRVASEAATMEYVEKYTNIRVPHVLHYGVDTRGDVRSPYILMSKVEGVLLSSVWDDMDDDKRRGILHQVIDILLELWSLRFDKKGALFKRADCEGKGAWYVESSSDLEDAGSTSSTSRLSTTTYAHAADYWIAYVNANLHDIYDEHFGSNAKAFIHAQAWFMRSLVPALFDPSLDTHGYPLCPGDFHSQNILITDVDTDPRITAIIDWEFSGPDFVTTFAYYPFFIVDHPAWDEDHPLRKRNVQDQATFDELILEAERNRSPVSGPPLSQLISNGYPIYLFQQIMQYPVTSSVFYPLFFDHVFGEGANDDFSVEYYWALMEGILKKDKERFDRENKVWLEAQEILGDEVVGIANDLRTGEFKDLVSKYLERFNDGGCVREWLASVD